MLSQNGAAPRKSPRARRTIFHVALFLYFWLILSISLLGMLFAYSVFAQTPIPERIVDAETPLQQAIDEQLRVYADGGRPEVLRTSNALIYPFGIYQPVLTCTVLRICIIELEAGEEVYSMGVGDQVRWNIDHGTTGPQGRSIYLTVVPTDYNLTTNLVISTNRRMYHMTLDSPPKQGRNGTLNPLEPYTRHVRFYYPEQIRTLSSGQSTDESLTQRIGTNLEDLNYAYHWRTENGFPWKPLAVFDDGRRVFLRIPPEAKPNGVLLIGTQRDSHPGNYLVRDGFLIIERTFDEARLIVPGPARKPFLRKPRQTQRSLIITRNQ